MRAPERWQVERTPTSQRAHARSAHGSFRRADGRLRSRPPHRGARRPLSRRPAPRQARARRRLRRRRRDARARRQGRPRRRARHRSEAGRRDARPVRLRGRRRHAGRDRVRVRTRFDVVLSSEAIEHTPDPRAVGARAVSPRASRAALLSLSMPNRLWQAPVRAASAIGLRPYDGYENFLWPQQLRAVLEQAGADIVEHRGIHLWPFQIKPLRGVSRWVDRVRRPPAAVDDQSVPALPETDVQFVDFPRKHIR